jgi:hypothetical protein
MLFQQDWSLIEECIAAGMAPPDEKLACNQGKYKRYFYFVKFFFRFSSRISASIS